MPRKRDGEVLVDPVAVAALIGQQEPDLAAQVRDHVREIEARGTHPEISVRMGEKDPACALGHENKPGTRFCGECGLAMDAPAPVKADLDAARPKPASQLTDEERTERDRQHAEALAAARQFEAQQTVYVPPEGETVVIHFIEDGLTFAGQVWYRGQEIEIGPAHPRWEQARGWILLDRMAQIERYGKQYFAPGPWPGRRSYLDGAGDFQRLYAGRDKDGKLASPFAGPGEEALRQADEMERRRGRAVPGPMAGLR
jgi:hypothetical protein